MVYTIISKLKNLRASLEVDKFLKAQRIIRETDNTQPTTSKKPSRRVNKKGQLAFDLIELNWRDLGFTPTDKGKDEDSGGSETSSRYIYSCADALTGLTFLRYSKTKARTAITPIAKECFQWFVKNLGLDGLAKLFCLSDKGSEFDFKLYKKWGVRTKQIQRSALIENKNAHIQRVLYRIAKMQKTTKIVELVKRTMAIVNKTQSSITKISPNEAKSVGNKVLAEKYNKNRGKDSGVKLKAKPLKIGDMVRLNKIGVKKDSFYKAYKGAWTKQSYKILTKRGDRYKIDGPKGKMFYHREMLRVTSAADQKTEKELKRRKEEREQQEIKETKKIRKKIIKTQTVSKRPRRKAAKKAMEKMFKAADRGKEIDKMLE
jgi:hypothetical protein